MKKIIIAVLGVLLFAGCGSKKIIDEERDFARDVWNRFTHEEFEVEVRNIDDYYNIDLTAMVDTAVFRYSTLPLTVNIFSPAGERRLFYTAIPLKESDRWKGEMKDGKREVTARVRTFFSFNSKGTHKIEIGQATSQYNLEGIGGIRLTITNTKVDYNDL